MKLRAITSFCILTLCSGCSGDPANVPADLILGCISDGDCHDEDHCTIDRCLDDECVHNSVVCDDPNFVCDVDTGACVCDEDSDCDDGAFCTGVESCSDGVCQSSDLPCEIDLQCDEDEELCFATTVEEIQNSTWLVLGFGEASGFTATAFGVAPDLLATNAHVTQALVALFQTEPDAQAAVFQHETGTRRNIGTVWSHPQYDSSIPLNSPDVGLLRVDEALPDHLDLPGAEVVQSLEVFDVVSSCGFPSDITLGIDLLDLLRNGGDFRPRTTCLQGTISALRPFDPSDPATSENTTLIQYDLPVIPGTSGSAVFDEHMQVVAVNFFRIGQQGDFTFGVRADKLAELLRWVDEGVVDGTELSEIEPQPIEACDTTYYSALLGFGFDVPSSFDGPFVDDFGDIVFVVSDPVTLVEQFTKFVVSFVFSAGLEDTVTAWIELKSDLAELLGLEEFTTSNGLQAFLLTWRVLGNEPWLDIFQMEAWAATPAGAYKLTGQAFRDDFFPKEALLEAAVRTICVDEGRSPTRTRATRFAWLPTTMAGTEPILQKRFFKTMTEASKLNVKNRRMLAEQLEEEQELSAEHSPQ